MTLEIKGNMEASEIIIVRSAQQYIIRAYSPCDVRVGRNASLVICVVLSWGQQIHYTLYMFELRTVEFVCATRLGIKKLLTSKSWGHRLPYNPRSVELGT